LTPSVNMVQSYTNYFVSANFFYVFFRSERFFFERRKLEHGLGGFDGFVLIFLKHWLFAWESLAEEVHFFVAPSVFGADSKVERGAHQPYQMLRFVERCVHVQWFFLRGYVFYE
jgi:hypothetical protein